MPGTDVLILRVCRHQAAEDTEVVRHRRDATARHLRGDMDRVEWHSRHQGQPVRASIFFTVSCEHCFQTRNAAKLNKCLAASALNRTEQSPVAVCKAQSVPDVRNRCLFMEPMALGLLSDGLPDALRPSASDGLDGLSSLRTGAVSYDRRLKLSAYRRLEVEQQR